MAIMTNIEDAGQQFTEKPWEYKHHMTAREIVENYKFSEGDLDWKTKSAFNEPLDFIGGTRRYTPTAEEQTSKNVHPGWSGHLGKMIQKHGYVDNPNDPIRIVEDHPSKGKTIVEGQHRVAVMFKLNPDQKIPVRKSNWSWILTNGKDLNEQEQSNRDRAEVRYNVDQERAKYNLDQEPPK
jgi:hypothetical protein